MYDLLLLGSLITSDKTGYKLQKIVGSALQPMRKVSSGVLYPSLERLEKEGLVTSTIYEDGRKMFIEKDLMFYQQAQAEMVDSQGRFPENAERFRILVEAYELDIQIAKTKLIWIKKQIADRK